MALKREEMECLTLIFYTYTLPKWIFYNIPFCVGGRFGKNEAYKE